MLALGLCGSESAFAADAPPPIDQLNFATVDTTLETLYVRPAPTGRGGPQLRDANAAPVPIKEFAFDGDPKTFFGSAKNPTARDHFTLIFDKPVTLKSITATTGKPDGSDKLDAGVLQVSSDGTTFTDAGKFADGIATTKNKGKVIAVRIKPSSDLTHPLAISEIAIDSDPKVMIFKYPVEIFLNYDDAPDMKDWAEKCAKICERQYYMLNEELKSDGFKPATWITMTLKERPNGVAETSGNRITGTVKYFHDHQKDFGAMVHETTHVVQHYRGRGNPGWLVEGLCDYVRFFKYEPGKIGGINPATAHYNGSYRVTARFLNYIVEKYDKDAIQKLNTAMREGRYKEDLFKEMTGKTLPELDEEWRATLKR